ncbi:MAG: hypothetical protein HXX10_00285 [Rhodoplanes sp.]|uniref:hypothetical protein n=1 Tax=Rhodoplanes sp. TaxID=1968906 RepID=UPI0018599666|nr:hypothetical protein [Rhodoplanes sp.]NVO12453.1 hypothetical protein [Rhodoplanes sp.]
MVRDDILPIAEALGAAAGLAEETFLQTGVRLGSSVDLLEHLTSLFGSLQGELGGDAFHRATEDLSQVGAKATALGGARRDERASLDRLTRVSAGLRRRIDEIAKEIRTIDVLTINARITASGIGAAGTEFLDYIGGIGRSLAITNTNLQHFRDDLVAVARHLAVASTGETVFATRHTETMAQVPRQLAHSLDLITARSRAAAEAAAAVGARSRKLADGVGRVVMALQVGDATRQRMEHVQASAGQLADLAGATAADDRHAPWADLGTEERRALVAAGCTLQAAQLGDAADELAREIAAVHRTLDGLAADAREIVRLGQTVYGSTAHGGESFLCELEEDVSQARALFEGFRTARESADGIIAEVLRIATRLVDHIGTVRAVEADIRIMGVNATLKSSRLGTVGKPLGVVAEELTLSSARTATEAVAATADVQAIVATAEALAGQNQAARLAEIAAVITAMDTAIARLHAVAETLGAALAALARDGAAVVSVLDETAAGLARAETIAAAIRHAAAAFAAVAAAAPARSIPTGEAADALFAQLAAHYTMARERDVHARAAPRGLATTLAPPIAAAAPAMAEASLDDMLF